MDYLASMFIDNELNLEEKGVFVEKIRNDDEFAAQTVVLLAQEKLLRFLPSCEVEEKVESRLFRDLLAWIGGLFRPLGYATAGFAVAILVISIFHQPQPLQTGESYSNRFVIYEPHVANVELAGTFTDWQRIPLHRLGNSGYWELKLDIPPGEHRFTYILDNNRRVVDPTLPRNELDDFGGRNSILSVSRQI